MNNAELEDACEALIEYAKDAVSNEKARNKLLEQLNFLSYLIESDEYQRSVEKGESDYNDHVDHEIDRLQGDD